MTDILDRMPYARFLGLQTLVSGDENTVIMLERSVRSDDPTAPGGWQITESRNYGETAVFYIESADDDSDIERSDDSAA